MYVPGCDNCEHRRDCAMFEANRELKETIWNIGREKPGRSDYILNGKYYPAEEVYGQCTDTAGSFHWLGTHSGEHKVKAEEGE